MPRGNGQIVNPAPVAIETNHRSGNQFLADRSNQKQLWLLREFACNVGVWIVPWAREIALLPERDNGCLIVRLKSSDVHVSADVQQCKSLAPPQ